MELEDFAMKEKRSEVICEKGRLEKAAFFSFLLLVENGEGGDSVQVSTISGHL
jgi:hypothetical protein